MQLQVEDIDAANRKLVADHNAALSITVDCWSSFNAGIGLFAITGHVLSDNMADSVSLILDCLERYEQFY